MAITNQGRTVQRIEVYPLSDSSAADTANAKHPHVMVCYEKSLGGTGADADTNGGVFGYNVHLHKFVEDGGAATDLSGHDALVQSVCTAIWS